MRKAHSAIVHTQHARYKHTDPGLALSAGFGSQSLTTWPRQGLPLTPRQALGYVHAALVIKHCIVPGIGVGLAGPRIDFILSVLFL